MVRTRPFSSKASVTSTVYPDKLSFDCDCIPSAFVHTASPLVRRRHNAVTTPRLHQTICQRRSAKYLAHRHRPPKQWQRSSNNPRSLHRRAPDPLHAPEGQSCSQRWPRSCTTSTTRRHNEEKNRAGQQKPDKAPSANSNFSKVQATVAYCAPVAEFRYRQKQPKNSKPRLVSDRVENRKYRQNLAQVGTPCRVESNEDLLSA